VAIGFDYRAFQQNVAFVDTTQSLIPDITVTPISLSYLGRMSRPGTDLSFSLAVSHNIPGGGDGNQEAFDGQRLGAEAKYSILRYAAAYSALMPGDLLFRFAFNGQHTEDLLIPGEQFGMGGQDSVRGFTERELANDFGHRASVELYSPDFGSRIGQNWRARVLTFFDTARGSDYDPVRSETNGLSSVGLGMRVSQGKSLFLRADWGYVTNGTQTRAAGNDRWHLGLGYTF
jgi:hemolysin activation/secretion protein